MSQILEKLSTAKSDAPNNRVLIIDDMDSIHEDYRKTLLGPKLDAAVAEEADELFGTSSAPATAAKSFHVDSAMQGQQGLEKVQEAIREGRPYAMAFVDMRMPPGWDGVQTIEQLWKVDPRLQIVICTAYADYSWDEITRQLVRRTASLFSRSPSTVPRSASSPSPSPKNGA